MLVRSDRSAVLAWSMLVATGVISVAFVALVVLSAESPGPLEFAEYWPMTAIYVALQLGLATIGALIARAQPDNSIGWLFGTAALAIALGFAATVYADLGLHLHEGLPGARYLALGDELSVVGLLLAVLFLLFLFPTGRPISRGWGWSLGVLTLGFTIRSVATILRPGPVGAFEDVDNPLGLEGTAGQVVGRVADALDVFTPVFLLVGTVALVVRFRRATGVERQQLRWFAFVAGCFGATLAVGFSFAGFGWMLAADVLWVLSMLCLTALPIVVGMAILRYRLYDLDRLVSRTVSYASLTAVLVACYLGATLVLGAFARGLLGRQTDLVVAASTLAVAAIFRPARRRIQAIVDVRFDRARYDAHRTVERFGQRLRDEVDLDALSDELLGVADRTVAPAAVSLWLRHERRP
jgi:hypothetical protein